MVDAPRRVPRSMDAWTALDENADVSMERAFAEKNNYAPPLLSVSSALLPVSEKH